MQVPTSTAESTVTRTHLPLQCPPHVTLCSSCSSPTWLSSRASDSHPFSITRRHLSLLFILPGTALLPCPHFTEQVPASSLGCVSPASHAFTPLISPIPPPPTPPPPHLSPPPLHHGSYPSPTQACTLPLPMISPALSLSDAAAGTIHAWEVFVD